MLTRSVLRRKYKNEDKPVPPEDQLDNISRQIVINAHQVIAKRGKNIWNELKEVCFDGYRKKEDSSE
jgi:Glu-tRNA(Gln) amidotransferase subunit E-like FAD-binding protein